MSIKDKVLKELEFSSYCPICRTTWDGCLNKCEKEECKEKLKELLFDTHVYYEIEHRADYDEAIDLTLAKVREKIEDLKREHKERKDKSWEDGWECANNEKVEGVDCITCEVYDKVLTKLDTKSGDADE